MSAELSALIDRGRTLGDARADRVRERIAAVVAAETPGVAVSIEDDAVVVAGRGVRWRALTEPALRWIGRMP